MLRVVMIMLRLGLVAHNLASTLGREDTGDGPSS